MTQKIILAATMSGATSSTFTLNQDMSAVTLICTGLASAETATVQIYDLNSATFIDYTPPSGVVKMTASINTVTISQTWGTFQVVKTMTAAAVGINSNQFYTP